ncbi:hypothetical protein BpHYR1_045261, partial [Brachionus plicatilis]
MKGIGFLKSEKSYPRDMLRYFWHLEFVHLNVNILFPSLSLFFVTNFTSDSQSKHGSRDITFLSEQVNSNDSEIDSSSQGFINNQYSLALDEEKDQVSKKSEITTTINPIVIKHKDHSDSNETSNSKKITSVVKIINNSSSSISKNTQASNSTVPLINMYESSPGNNKFIDDFNNNQLKLGNETNVSTLTTVSQIARIHSSGTYATQNGQN